MIVDVTGSYQIKPHLTLFANLTSVNDSPLDNEAYGSATPGVAKLRNRTTNGAQWAFGLKSDF